MMQAETSPCPCPRCSAAGQVVEAIMRSRCLHLLLASGAVDVLLTVLDKVTSRGSEPMSADVEEVVKHCVESLALIGMYGRLAPKCTFDVPQGSLDCVSALLEASVPDAASMWSSLPALAETLLRCVYVLRNTAKSHASVLKATYPPLRKVSGRLYDAMEQECRRKKSAPVILPMDTGLSADAPDAPLPDTSTPAKSDDMVNPQEPHEPSSGRLLQGRFDTMDSKALATMRTTMFDTDQTSVAQGSGGLATVLVCYSLSLQGICQSDPKLAHDIPSELDLRRCLAAATSRIRKAGVQACGLDPDVVAFQVIRALLLVCRGKQHNSREYNVDAPSQLLERERSLVTWLLRLSETGKLCEQLSLMGHEVLSWIQWQLEMKGRGVPKALLEASDSGPFLVPPVVRRPESVQSEQEMIRKVPFMREVLRRRQQAKSRHLSWLRVLHSTQDAWFPVAIFASIFVVVFGALSGVLR
mmetsp:Transcript_18109/g.40025  ORF Transcript_18109/g.40025 Transcript_18109/m.40025 type:complete len:470 (-) Transcript_18109:162-1571(-)